MKDPELRKRDGQRNCLKAEELNGPQNINRLVAMFESVE
jgi:hypothetical protein